MSENLDGTFIDVEIEDSIRDDAELAKKLEEVCPVDIFTAANGKVEVVVRAGQASIDAKTLNGAVELSLPADFAGHLDAKLGRDR